MSVADGVIRPEREIAWEVVTRPGGVETREEKTFRLKDYFSDIDLLASEADGIASFRLVFHIRDGVTSFWKDMLTAVLADITRQVPGVKTSITPGGSKS